MTQINSKRQAHDNCRDLTVLGSFKFHTLIIGIANVIEKFNKNLTCNINDNKNTSNPWISYTVTK